jgi:protein O-GlcNAc transferase
MTAPQRSATASEKALARHHAGDRVAAEAAYREALAADPGDRTALDGLGVLLVQSGRHEEAIAPLERAAAMAPADAQGQVNLGSAYAGGGRLPEAIAAFRLALAQAPDHRHGWRNLAAALLQAGELDDAGVAIERLLELAPDQAEPHRLAADLAMRSKRPVDAARIYADLVGREPADPRFEAGLAGALAAQGKFAAAIPHWRKATALRPDRADYWNHLGTSCRSTGDSKEAVEAQRRATALAPDRANYRLNLGAALYDQGALKEAMAAFRGAIELDRSNALAWRNFGSALEMLGRNAEAANAYREAFRLEPGNASGQALLLNQLLQQCDWAGAAPLMTSVAAHTRSALAAGRKPEETPLAHLSRSSDETETLAVARAWVKQACSRLAGSPLRRRERDLDPDRRLRIGYFSSDMHDHPVAHLTVGLFERHDRRVVELSIYSHGRADSSPWRQRAEAAADRFVDLQGMSQRAMAERIAADGIDILVDLNGHSSGARMEVLSLRPAPIQALWLGYPGSSGADFIDYLITDIVATPPEAAMDYSEALLWLPHVFQPNDDKQTIAAEPMTRARWGLPEDGVVFCSFNQGFKIEPASFALWMELLRELPRSVLWLRSPSAEMLANLRREAAAHGVEPERLIFADRPEKPVHLQRLSLADIALDTWTYNGHTTSSDALWAGLPVITLEGGHYASRVSASVLHALGLPELIARSQEEYRALALRYGRDRSALAALKARLAANRKTMPLFDTARFAHNLERGYRQIWRWHVRGAAPAAIRILEPSGADESVITRAAVTAIACRDKGDRVKAIAAYRELLALDPAHVEGQLSLAGLLRAEGAEPEAVMHDREAVALDPHSSPGWLGLAAALTGDPMAKHRERCRRFAAGIPAEGQHLHDTVEACRASLHVDPRQVEVWNRLIRALRDLHRDREAEEAFAEVHRHLIEDNPSNAEAHRLRGMALLALGRLKEGYEEYEWRWQTAEFAKRPRRILAPLWQGEPVAGRRVLLQWEQGLGDCLQYLRFAPALHVLGAELVAELPAPLVRLAQSTPALGQVIAAGEAPGAVDFQVSLISLPHRLGTTLETIPAEIPYLAAPEEDRARWAVRLKDLPRPLIGLAWRGSPSFVNDARRSMALASFMPILSQNGAASWISLQKDMASSEVTESRSILLDPATDLGAPAERFADFADTAGLIAALDLVIAVDTAVAHLAGALGKPVWVLLPRNADARWLVERADSPWYPTARLFRQIRRDDWTGPLESLDTAVGGFIAGHPSAATRTRASAS